MHIIAIVLVILSDMVGADINLSLPGQNGCQFTHNNFWCTSVNEKICILTKISLKYVPKDPIDNNPALV